MPSLKILHTVEFYHPSVGGAQEAVRQISENLVKMGHDVTVATTKLRDRIDSIINGVKIIDFNVSGNFVSGFNGESGNYQNFLLNSNFDIIMNYAAQQWTTDLMLPILKDIKGKKVMVPCGFSGLFQPVYKGYYKRMENWLRSYDACVYLSRKYRDIDFSKSAGINNDYFIPNGASYDEFSKKTSIDIRKTLAIPKTHFLILHVGSHTGLKGHKECIKIFNKAKIEKATLLIVADKNSSLCYYNCHFLAVLANNDPFMKKSDKKILIHALSRAETISAYHNANLFLFPSNVECSPLVLFESMASKTPFLATDVGNSSEIVEWSKGGLLLPTTFDKSGNSHARIAESVNILEMLYHDQALRDRMGKLGFETWKNNFTWESIAHKYEELYFNLM